MTSKSRSLSLLRLMCECGQPSVAGSPVKNCMACQVKADYERLRAALARIEAMDGADDDGPTGLGAIARAALQGETEVKP